MDFKGENRKMIGDGDIHYCYVYGGKRNLNFHGWLSNISIEKLRSEGCTVEIRDYQYTETQRGDR